MFEGWLVITKSPEGSRWCLLFLNYCMLTLHAAALDLQPDDPMVLKRRADVRGKLGMNDAAIADYRQAIELQGRIQYLQTGK